MQSTRRRSLCAAMSLVVLLSPAVIAEAVSGSTSDDQFIETLAEQTGTAIDRRRLAKLLFGLAATLDGDKSSVRLLHERVAAPDGTERAVLGLLQARYEDYVASLDRFKAGVSELLDEPDSLLLLHRVLTAGQRSCRQLDLHESLLASYSSGARSAMGLLSSREACSRIQTVALQPRIEALIHDALVERVYQREEIRALKAELGDLEKLLADLRAIDESD